MGKVFNQNLFPSAQCSQLYLFLTKKSRVYSHFNISFACILIFMNSQTLLVVLFFIFMLGAGIGFYLASLIF